jgi:hypothetical protein
MSDLVINEEGLKCDGKLHKLYFRSIGNKCHIQTDSEGFSPLLENYENIGDLLIVMGYEISNWNHSEYVVIIDNKVKIFHYEDLYEVTPEEYLKELQSDPSIPKEWYGTYDPYIKKLNKLITGSQI